MREYFRIAMTVGFPLYWLIAIVRKYMQMKAWMLLIFLQTIRNTGIKKRLFQADAAVRDAGYGPPHQQALIRVCDIEAVVPGKHMELFCERPVFLQERMRRLGR